MTDGDALSPVAVSPDADRSSSRRPWYFWAATAALVLVVAVVVAAAVRPRPQDDYDEAVRQRFLAACTARGGDAVIPPCICLYDQLVANVPFDRFELLDETLEIQTQSTPEAPLQLPDDIEVMLDECVAEPA